MWRFAVVSLALSVSYLGIVAGAAVFPAQAPLTLHDPATSSSISIPFFADLERLSRLVDIAYCIGITGVSKPFECASRCNEFPSLTLATTWNTGVLLSDSCGYIAVDNGTRPHDEEHGLENPYSGQPSIIVAFRGTYSIANTVVDLSTVPQAYVPYSSPDHGGGEPPEEPEHRCDNCTVHMGFLESWKNARELVLPELKQLRERYPNYPIRLVGHSLGGAVACLAALELKVSFGWDDVVITTFGEPRLGNYDLVRFIDEVFDLDGVDDLEKRSYRRVTHDNDPVPLLPLGEWGYRSHSGEIFIAKEALSPDENDIRTCIGDEDPACSAYGDSSFQAALGRILPFWASEEEPPNDIVEANWFPTKFKLWQLFFSHRDYFWRLGLCVPGGDPANWGRDKYEQAQWDEL